MTTSFRFCAKTARLSHTIAFKVLATAVASLILVGSLQAQKPADQKNEQNSATKNIPKGITPLIFESKTTGARLGPLRMLVEQKAGGYTIGGVLLEASRFTWDYQEDSLTLNFDPTIIRPQVMFVLTSEGKTLGLSEIFSSNLEINKSLEAIERKSKRANQILNGVIDVHFSKEVTTKLNNTRICISEEEWDGLISYCSGLISKNSKANASAQVLVNNLKVVDKGEIILKENEDLQFMYQLQDSSFIKGTYRVTPSELKEAYLSTNGEVVISFFSTPPATPHELISQKRSPIFAVTIGDMRKVHEVRVPENIPFVHYKVSKGIVISQRLYFNFLPKEEERFYLNPNTPSSTYNSSIRLKGTLGKYKKEQLADPDVLHEKDQFLWTYKSAVTGKINRDTLVTPVARVNPEGGQQTYPLGHSLELYRARATYISTRAGISVGSDSNIALNGELAAQHWFEKLFSDNHYLSRHRWGLRGTFTQSAGSTAEDAEFKQNHIDIIYRLNAGVENWDETFGVSAGVHSFQLGNTFEWMAPAVGLVWHRSAPPWFDTLTDFLPYFRRPKWVNFSALLFSGSMSANIEDAYGMQVSALGRVELTQSLFLEGGWAVSAFSYISTDGDLIRDQVTVAFGRGYLGVGVYF